MKKIAVTFALAASLGLAACDKDPEPTTPPVQDEVVIVDDCPEGKSTTGEPCR